MPLKSSKSKPSLAERNAAKARREDRQRGKGIDKERQRKTSRNGGALKRNKKIELNGAERYWVQNTIQKIPISARTVLEKQLLRKVK